MDASQSEVIRAIVLEDSPCSGRTDSAADDPRPEPTGSVDHTSTRMDVPAAGTTPAVSGQIEEKRKRKTSAAAVARSSPPARSIAAACAVGESSVILLHPPLPLVGVSIVVERERQHNDSLADGYSRRRSVQRRPHRPVRILAAAGALSNRAPRVNSTFWYCDLRAALSCSFPVKETERVSPSAESFSAVHQPPSAALRRRDGKDSCNGCPASETPRARALTGAGTTASPAPEPPCQPAARSRARSSGVDLRFLGRGLIVSCARGSALDRCSKTSRGQGKDTELARLSLYR